MEVHVIKTILMQRLMDAVLRGYTHHIHGAVTFDKAEKLCEKFTHHYRIADNTNQRYYAKKMGRANTRLFFYHAEGEDKLHWWLLATKGDGDVHRRERLLDARDRQSRIRSPGDYELLPLTRPKAHGGGTSWTWRMTKETYTTWRARMISCGRSRSNLLARQALYSLRKTPGFGGIRRQIGKLRAELRKTWIRHHGNDVNLPGISKLPYLQRETDHTVELHEFLRQIK